MDERELKKSVKPGDLIEVFRPGYQHWAVYIGNEEVVHLSHPNFNPSSSLALSSGSFRAVVMRQSIQEVLNGDRANISNFLDKSKYFQPREQRFIVQGAISRVGEEMPYRLTTKNCEHFATELRYGKAVSRQGLTITNMGSILAKSLVGSVAFAGAVTLGLPTVIAASASALMIGLFTILGPHSGFTQL